jgi:hypothetical protein
MTFWQRVGRWLDLVLGGPDHSSEIDSSRVDTAIRLIQSTIEDQQREQQVRRLRVSDLDEAHQAQLASQLQQLLGKSDANAKQLSSQPTEDSA